MSSMIAIVSRIWASVAADIAASRDDPPGGSCPKVLALGGRPYGETVVPVRFDRDLRVEPADGRGQRHHVDHGGPGREDALCRYDYRRVTKASFSALGQAEVEVDHITRGQHRARPSHRRVAAEPAAPRHGLGAERERQGRRCDRPSSRARPPAASAPHASRHQSAHSSTACKSAYGTSGVFRAHALPAVSGLQGRSGRAIWPRRSPARAHARWRQST